MRSWKTVVSSQYFVLGPEVQGLEEELAEYLGVRSSVGVASGTDALLLPLRALEPLPGDEVIIPSFTFFATAGAAWNSGFKPVFCDVDPNTFNVTLESLEAVWTERTRAVVPVHLYGQMAPMAEICQWADRRGSSFWKMPPRPLGHGSGLLGQPPLGPSLESRRGRVGIWDFRARGVEDGWGLGRRRSLFFFPTKNLGGFGDGGLVTAQEEDFAEKIAKLRVHGGRQMYHHEMVGTNSRLDALQAAVLRVKLPHLNGWADRRRRNAALYDEMLSGLEEVQTPFTEAGNHHVYNQYTLRVHQRDELRDYLGARGIGTGLYYPLGLDLQECFRSLGGKSGDLPQTEALTKEVVSLPIFPELTEGQVKEVAGAIREFYAG